MRRSFAPAAVLPAVAVAVTLALSLFAARPAAAGGGPEKVFAGKILTSDKKFPSYAKSPAAYTAALRKQNKANFWEDKAKKSWRIYFAAFFKKGLSDIEVVVKLYDLNSSPKALIGSFEQYVEQRGQTALLSNITLQREQVGVNRNVLMVIEVGGRAVASGKFKLLGEVERLSGKVDFSEEDTRKSDDDE